MNTISYANILVFVMVFGFVNRFGVFFGLLASFGAILIGAIVWALVTAWASE